jgi:hypothetical protein
VNERAALLVIGIALFVAGCGLGAVANEQILGEIVRTLSPTLALMVPVSVATQVLLPLSIAVAPGLFLATPIIAMALAKPAVPSLLLRGFGCYLLSALISGGIALMWFHRTITSPPAGESTLHFDEIPVLSVILAGPMIVIALAWFLGAQTRTREQS